MYKDPEPHKNYLLFGEKIIFLDEAGVSFHFPPQLLFLSLSFATESHLARLASNSLSR